MIDWSICKICSNPCWRIVGSKEQRIRAYKHIWIKWYLCVKCVIFKQCPMGWIK